VIFTSSSSTLKLEEYESMITRFETKPFTVENLFC
jgi:hypothetical protein